MTITDVQRRFGFVIKSHRIGSMAVRVAEIDRVDALVAALYPDALAGHGDAPVWMITWPSAFALAEFVVMNSKAASLRVLELGCGTAAPGIALAMAGARVVSTDYDPLALELARYNTCLNGCTSIDVRFLDWYRPDIAGRFDLIVGSEVVYFEPSFAPLLGVLRRYLARTGKIIFADPGRHQLPRFLKLCVSAGYAYRQHRQMVYRPEADLPIRITVLEPGEAPVR